jgi:histidinol-phosphate/aromatic aminotransferase/cobyric acid decarboxylase-like protein
MEILTENPHLYVMKSISKSYGVPGLRLGVMASGDTKLISDMKKDVSIWNINSFAEFYMQIEEKYKKDYTLALDKFRTERKRFEAELNQIEGLRVIQSQANFVMTEIVNGMTSSELTNLLAAKYNILIKDLSGKIHNDNRQYIRIAIKNTEENNLLIDSLRNISIINNNKSPNG